MVEMKINMVTNEGHVCFKAKLEDNELNNEEFSRLSNKVVKYLATQFYPSPNYEMKPQPPLKLEITKCINPELIQAKREKEEKSFRNKVKEFEKAYNQFKEEFKN